MFVYVITYISTDSRYVLGCYKNQNLVDTIIKDTLGDSAVVTMKGLKEIWTDADGVSLEVEWVRLT